MKIFYYYYLFFFRSLTLNKEHHRILSRWASDEEENIKDYEEDFVTETDLIDIVEIKQIKGEHSNLLHNPKQCMLGFKNALMEKDVEGADKDPIIPHEDQKL